jgi:hypothetical protein
MSDDLLRRIAADLNGAPGAAGRAPRMAPQVSDVNAKVAAEALRALALDSSPYSYQTWLAGEDQR